MSSKSKHVLVLSFDIEADGDSPACNSMRSIGIAAKDEEGKKYEFYRTLIPLEGHVVDKRCKEEFWDKNPEAWAEVNKNPVSPGLAMIDLNEWLKELRNTFELQWVAYPAAYDWQWLNYYFCAFRPLMEDQVDIGFDVICLKTMFNEAWMTLRHYMPFQRSKSQFKDKISMAHLFTAHNALDDAKRQLVMFHSLSRITSEVRIKLFLNAPSLIKFVESILKDIDT